jgi:hypothetical protein
MLSNVLFILLGAGLVSVGFLAAALAEHIRGHVPRETEPRAQLNRVQKATLISLDEGAALIRPTPTAKTPRVSRTEAKVVTSTGGDEVIAALVAAGYKKPIATEATWACGVAERATIEGWAASALRRCGRGGAS